MNVLIVFASHDGQTEKIARFLAERMREKDHRVDVMDAAHPRPEVSLDRYQAVVIGAPVRAGKYPRAAINFARANRARLEQMPAAFFSVCLAAASQKEAERRAALALPERFFRESGWRPRLVATFAGALRYTRYNWLIRFIMKRIAKAEGASTDTSRDHEYTDWNAVTAFAERVLSYTPMAGSSSSSPQAP
jgi:menaquinone-dependent protoporphyrinogen oxidase